MEYKKMMYSLLMIKLKRNKITYNTQVKSKRLFKIHKDLDVEKGIEFDFKSKDLDVEFEMDSDDPEALFIPLEELYEFADVVGTKGNEKSFPIRSLVKGAKYGVQVSLKEDIWWRLRLTAYALSEIRNTNVSISQCLDKFLYNSVLSSLSIHSTSTIKDELNEEFLNETDLIKEKLKFVILAKDEDGNEEIWENNIPDLTFHLIAPLRELLLLLVKPEYSIYKEDESVIDLQSFLDGFIDEETNSKIQDIIIKGLNGDPSPHDINLKDLIVNSEIDFVSLWAFSKKYNKNHPNYRAPENETDQMNEDIQKVRIKNLAMLAAMEEDGIKAFEKKFNTLKAMSSKFGKFKVN